MLGMFEAKSMGKKGTRGIMKSVSSASSRGESSIRPFAPSPFRRLSGSLAVILCIFLLLSSTLLHSQDRKAYQDRGVALKLKAGYLEDGSVSPSWLDAIKYHRRNQETSLPAFIKRKLQPEEILWVELIKTRVSVWSGMIDSLRIPFGSIKPPGLVTVLIGNQGGDDAFVFADSIICFDLSMLNQVYGSASKSQNQDRIDRFFAHEFTHLLHKAWRKELPVNLDSPLNTALWECLTEGLGNYRSLSGRWVDENGELTLHALETLNRLQPVFVERISALDHATEEEAKVLMSGLSMGRFDQKWGALTVALWLAREAGGDDSNLKKWVDSGPAGILQLARKYLPDNLKESMPQ